MTEVTTEAVTQEQAPTEVQPDEQQAEATSQTPVSEPQTQQPNDEQTTEEPVKADNSEEESFDYQEWLSKKGIDPSTPKGQEQIAKSWRELENKMHQSTQRSSELEKQLTSTPPQVSEDPMVQALADQVFQMQQTQEVREFIRESNVSDSQRAEFAKWFQENPVKQQLVDNGYMSVQEAYALSGIGKADTSSIKDEGKREALEQLANKQRATAPKGGATTSNAPEGDPILDVLLTD